MSNILELKGVNKEYKVASETLHILKDLYLEVEAGEFVSIVGKSGSGKSTLLNIIGLLDSFDSGNLIINGETINKKDSKKIDFIKNKELGFVFQFHHLLPEFNVIENVMLPALVGNFSKKDEIQQKASSLLKEVGLEDREKHKPNQLSGGEKQRVAIARALINEPSIILADEPTGNLDEETSDVIHKLLKKINKEKKQTIIAVTHSKELADIADKKYTVKNGCLIQEKI